MLLSLVIPTYNERENIAVLVQRVTATLKQKTEDFEIIVVDDDSPDGTWKVAEELTATNPHLRVIRRRAERGLATAVVAGWKSARGEIVGVMDGDLQHPPETLPALLDPLVNKEADITVGSRHIEGGGVSEWGFHRRFLSWVISWFTRCVLQGILPPLRDPMSGYFLARRSVVQGANLQPKGYKILLETLAKGAYQTVLEVPYIFSGRKRGASKAGLKVCLESVIHLGQLLAQSRHRRFRPKRLARNLFSRPAELVRALPLNRLDILCLIIVALIGVTELPQPFNSDQAQFTIMARQLNEGSVPYRDLWDVKQPGILYFFLAGGFLFGFDEVGVHLFELCYMMVFAVIFLLTFKNHFSSRAIASLIPLFTVGVYFVTSGDWHQTQPESLMGAPTFLSLWFAFKSLQPGANRRLWLFASGLMGGLVLLFKFMFLPILVAFWLTAFCNAVRLREKPVLATAVAVGLPSAVGLLIPVLAMLAYFASHDVLNLALWTFFAYPIIAVREWPLTAQLGMLVNSLMWFLQRFAPLLALSTIGAYASLGPRKRYLTVNLILWIVLGFAIILLQRLSWWEYHFMVFFVPLGLLGARGLDVVWMHLKRSGSQMPARSWQVVAALSVVLLFSPILSRLALTSIMLARDGFLTAEDRLRYQRNVTAQYNVAFEEVAFLWDATSLSGAIYVFGDPLYYYLSGRDPAIPILTRVFAPPDLWARKLKRLYEARPSYIFVCKDTLEAIRKVTPQAKPYMEAANRYIDQHYYVLRESAAGTWYVVNDSMGYRLTTSPAVS